LKCYAGEMRKKRRYKRYRRRLETEISVGEIIFNGISTNLSARGLFIRTQQPFKIGTAIDIKIYLPEDRFCKLKGVVKYSKRVIKFTYKNGMGIEIIQKDEDYINYLKTLKY
jgi:Tfp pilus assembly protein PilZ